MYSEYVPDDLDRYEEYEREVERRHRIYKRLAHEEMMADMEVEEERDKHDIIRDR